VGSSITYKLTNRFRSPWMYETPALLLASDMRSLRANRGEDEGALEDDIKTE
jgi:hypothetical protein